MEYEYKGYTLEVEIYPECDKGFRLKGKCKYLEFETHTFMSDDAFERIIERFKQKVDYFSENIKQVSGVTLPQSTNSYTTPSIGEETLVGYLKRISRHSTFPKETDDALIQVANLFAGVLPYNLSDIKKRYFALLESKEENN